MHSVDVVVPCYRYAHFLRQCVTSALTQSGATVRVLIIDDASPDDTAQVAAALVEQDSRVTVFRHPRNVGHIRTYNEGIEWASAEYMLILSADDYLLPGALSRAGALLTSRADVGFTFGQALALGEHDVPSPVTVSCDPPWTVFSGHQFIRLSGARNIVSTPTAVVRTELQKRIGGYRPDLPHSGDMEMWLRFAARASVGVVNACQAVYRRHSSNMSLAYSANAWLPDVKQRKAALDSFFACEGASMPYRERLQARLYRQLAVETIGFASQAFNHNDSAGSEELAKYAVTVYPRITASLAWTKFACKRRIGQKAWRVLQAGRPCADPPPLRMETISDARSCPRVKSLPAGMSCGTARLGRASSSSDAAAVIEHERRYEHALKSTAVIGGSSLLNIVFGVARTKAFALMVGPAGIGMMGLYTAIVEVAQSIAGMGIQNSGVRQIAEAAGTGDPTRIAGTAAVLKRVAIGLGLGGAVLLLLGARRVSAVTFGTEAEAGNVAFLALAVLFREVAAGQTALIQGLRRISDLARLNVLSSVCGTVISIPIVYVWGTGGLALSLVAMAAVSIGTSWWYSRKVNVLPVTVSPSQVRRETASLLKLGLAFMSTGFLTMGAAYVIRLLVLRLAGPEAAGLYQSAWTLGGLYVAFILQSMGADFYPRLSAVARDDAACNRMVNEQALISVLLAGPGVLATLTLAPLVITVFYSAQFYPAISILRWICLGMMLRVVAWPMGFVIVAKGAQNVMIATEVAAALVHVGLAWMLVNTIGIDGSGAAFFGLYVWHGLLVYAIVRRATGFRWSRENRRVGMTFLPLTGLVFCGFYVLPSWLALAVGLTVTVLSGLYSARALMTLLPHDWIPPAARTWPPLSRAVAFATGRQVPLG